MQKLFKLFILFLLLAALGIGAALYAAVFKWRSTSAGELDIPPGTSVVKIGRMLEQAHVIRTPQIFAFWVRLSGKQGRLKAGYYIFEPDKTLAEVADMIEAGRVKAFNFTIVEGWSIADVANSLKSQTFSQYSDLPAEFARLARDPQFIASLGLSNVASLEGYIFPETYQVTYSTTAADLLRQAVGRFNAVFTDAWRQRGKGMGFTEQQVVTLASIVEKETGKADERPLIASVFLNRLKRGMLLQSDPTTIYGLERFDGNLRKQDLSDPHPYNTYVHAGLQPGPIASPGKESLQAALFPAETDYLYFVSLNDGSHVFSRNLAEHTRA